MSTWYAIFISLTTCILQAALSRVFGRPRKVLFCQAATSALFGPALGVLHHRRLLLRVVASMEVFHDGVVGESRRIENGKVSTQATSAGFN